MEVISLEKAREIAKKGNLTEEEKQLLIKNLEFRKDILKGTAEKIRTTRDLPRLAALCKKFLFDYEDYLEFKEVCWYAGIKL